MERKTATTEHRTPKMPFSAQNQGVSDGHTDFANRMPVGKNIPISNPNGKMIAIEARIFRNRSAVTMFLNRMLSRNLSPIIQTAVTTGKMYNQGYLTKGRRSLRRLPTPALAMIVKRRIPRA